MPYLEEGLLGQYLVFPDDDELHEAGWQVFIPLDLRDLSPLNVKLVFATRKEPSKPVGNAPVSIKIYSFNEESTGVPVLETTIDRTIVMDDPTGDTEHYSVTFAIDPYVTTSTTHLVMVLSRNSSSPSDTLNGNLHFVYGRTI